MDITLTGRIRTIDADAVNTTLAGRAPSSVISTATATLVLEGGNQLRLPLPDGYTVRVGDTVEATVQITAEPTPCPTCTAEPTPEPEPDPDPEA